MPHRVYSTIKTEDTEALGRR